MPPPQVQALDLAPHPEGGWYRRTWTSPVLLDTPHGPRPSATAILYLLDDVSAWHRLRSAELWLWHSGSGVELTLGGAAAHPEQSERIRLDAGNPQLTVPAGHWQTARLHGRHPALLSCVVSPGFDFTDFDLA